MKHLFTTILVATVLGATSGFATGVTDSAGRWQGKGTSFGLDGAPIGSFSIGEVSEANGDHRLESKITILADGQAQTFQQVLEDADRGFHITSDQGNGGGYCFGQGLCEAYLGTADHGYAVSITLDGPDHRRMLVTEIRNGRAVKFVRESLQRLE
jgi:hypothetical protein